MGPNSKKPTVKRYFWYNQGSLTRSNRMDLLFFSPKSHPTLCDPMNCSTPGFPVLHYLPEFAQIHVHWVDDAILPPHPLLLPSPFALNLSQPQNLFKWVDSSYQVAKILELQLQHQSFQWFPLGLIGLILHPRDSQESSPTRQFKSINSLVLGFLDGPTLTSTHDYWKNHSFD